VNHRNPRVVPLRQRAGSSTVEVTLVYPPIKRSR